MTSPEKHKIFEYDREQVLALIDELKFETFEKFKFNGQDHYIILLKEDEVEGGDIAWFSKSTELDGFDFYISEALTGEKRRRAMFHELLEACCPLDGAEAHAFALHEEEKIFGKRS